MPLGINWKKVDFRNDNYYSSFLQVLFYRVDVSW